MAKLYGTLANSSQDGQIHSPDGIAKCHSAGHNNSPKVAIPILTPDRAEKKQNGRRFKENDEPMFTLTAQNRHGVGIEVVGTCEGKGFVGNESRKRIYSENGIAPCLNGIGNGGNTEPKVSIGIIDTQGRKDKTAELKDICPTLRSETHGNLPEVCANVTGNIPQQGNGIYVEMPEGFIVYAVWYEKEQCYITVRKLTPKECFRLQGWTDDYFEKAVFVNSDSQLYKQAGNGVTVPVVHEIGKKIKESDTY